MCSWFKLRPYVPTLNAVWQKETATFSTDMWKIAAIRDGEHRAGAARDAGLPRIRGHPARDAARHAVGRQRQGDADRGRAEDRPARSRSTRVERVTRPIADARRPPRYAACAARRWIPFAFLAPALPGCSFSVYPIGLRRSPAAFSGQSIRGDSIFVGVENYPSCSTIPRSGRPSDHADLQSRHQPVPGRLRPRARACWCGRPTRQFIDVFRTSFLLPMTVSIALTSMIWSIMLDPTLGPVNGFLRWAGLPAQPFFRSGDQALTTLILVATWKGAGYWMVFLLAGLLAIPSELDEARHRRRQCLADASSAHAAADAPAARLRAGRRYGRKFPAVRAGLYCHQRRSERRHPAPDVRGLSGGVRAISITAARSRSRPSSW